MFSEENNPRVAPQFPVLRRMFTRSCNLETSLAEVRATINVRKLREQTERAVETDAFLPNARKSRLETATTSVS